jgi:VanZ family protein
MVKHFVPRLARALTAIAMARHFWGVLLLLLTAAVSYLALTPMPPHDVYFAWDKVNHVLAFSTLALCASLSCPASRRARLIMFVMLFAYGGMIEALQHFIPGRAAEWADLGADAIGIVLGAVMAAGVLRKVTGKAPAV